MKASAEPHILCEDDILEFGHEDDENEDEYDTKVSCGITIQFIAPNNDDVIIFNARALPFNYLA